MKLLRVLKRPNSRACALEITASFLVLPVPCVPGPMGDPGDEDVSIVSIYISWPQTP